MKDAVAFIRDLVPHQLVEDALARAFPRGKPVPDAMARACASPGAPW